VVGLFLVRLLVMGIFVMFIVALVVGLLFVVRVLLVVGLLVVFVVALVVGGVSGALGSTDSQGLILCSGGLQFAFFSFTFSSLEGFFVAKVDWVRKFGDKSFRENWDFLCILAKDQGHKQTQHDKYQ